MSRRRARGEAHSAAHDTGNGAGHGTGHDRPATPRGEAGPGASPNAAPKLSSRTTIDGSLCDHPPRKLLDLCQRQRVTGTLQIVSWGRKGRIELRAGQIMTAAYGPIEGSGAVPELLALRDGMFELHQELPRLPTGPGAARVGLAAVMQQCRERALSCRIHASSRGQRAIVTYRAGELERAELDGVVLDAASSTTALAPFEHAQLQVDGLPISLDVAPGPAPAQRPGTAPTRPASSADSRPTTAPTAPPLRASSTQGGVVSGEIVARPTPPPRPAPPPIPARPSRHVPPMRPSPPMRPAPPMRPSPPPPPIASGRPQPGAALTPGMQPWLPGPAISSGATASWRDAPQGRRELALPAVLAVLALSLVLIIGFMALQP